MNDQEILENLNELLIRKMTFFESKSLNSFNREIAIRNLAKASICRQLLTIIDLLKIDMKDVDLI